MSKREQKLEQKPAAKPVSITNDGELGEEQLKQVSGGIVVTKVMDSSSPHLLSESLEGTSTPAKP